MKVPLLHEVLDIIKNEEYSLSHDTAIDSFCGSITLSTDLTVFITGIIPSQELMAKISTGTHDAR